MPDGQVLEFTNVTKRFNEVTAVSDLSARVEPGAVTAFLGPNGAGKTTTLRILLGQIRATSGTATIGGTAFTELRQPLRTIGSVLEETAYRPRRTASRQLTIAAKANGIALSRVDEVLAEVGLDGEGDSRIGGFSLGMRQRLSVAHALLGDPGALVFDEPANGLDPEGIRWMRLLMRRLADEGRTVLVSSHVLSEVEQVADNVLVLSKGQLVLSSGIETLADPSAGSVVVDAADRAALTAALSTAGFDVEVLRSGLTVRGGDASTVGAVAAAAGIALSTLVQRGPTLEDVFIDLVRGGKLEARASAAASQLALRSSSTSAFAGPAAVSALPVIAAPPLADNSADADDATGTDDAVDADAAADAGFVSASEVAVSDEDAMIAEVAAVSASLSESAPTDPVAAAVIASGADDSSDAPYLDDADFAAEDAVAAAAVEEAASTEGSLDADLSHVDTSDEDATAIAAAEEAADEISTDAGADEAPESADGSAPAAPSFDEILFGTTAPDTESTFPRSEDAPVHDIGQIFSDQGADETATAGSDEASESGDAEGSVDADTRTEESESGSVSESAESPSEDAGDTSGDEPSGIDIFEALDDASDESADEQTDAVENSDENAAEESAEDADPRSAAVSSMLAAAARAYYEEEPKDYPLGDQPTEESSTWSVASTGVIDTVPTDASGESSEPEEGERSHEGDNQEHHEGEHHEGEHHEREHHEGEHHEHHDGDHHEGGDNHHG